MPWTSERLFEQFRGVTEPNFKRMFLELFTAMDIARTIFTCHIISNRIETIFAALDPLIVLGVECPNWVLFSGFVNLARPTLLGK
jgi:hypothetical protein